MTDLGIHQVQPGEQPGPFSTEMTVVTLMTDEGPMHVVKFTIIALQGRMTIYPVGKVAKQLGQQFMQKSRECLTGLILPAGSASANGDHPGETGEEESQEST